MVLFIYLFIYFVKFKRLQLTLIISPSEDKVVHSYPTRQREVYWLCLGSPVLCTIQQRSWFRHCATSLKVAGSIADVIRFFNSQSFQQHCGHVADSASNRIGY
jgi:hypothetical protein